MRGNLSGPEGLAGRGASAALHGLPVVHHATSRAPCIRSLSRPTRLTRNTQTGSLGDR